MTRDNRRPWLVAALVAALALLLGSVVAAVGWAGNTESDRIGLTRSGASGQGPGSWSGTTPAAPSLPGTVVNVTATNMGGAMTGGAMMGRANGMHGGMSLLTDHAQAPRGQVSFFVTNAGSVDHELVVLPLAGGQSPGTRPIGDDGRIDETGSLGEASASGSEGAGEGIRPGTSGWVTITLPPGRYELVCNLPGHYAAGMYTVLTVT